MSIQPIWLIIKISNGEGGSPNRCWNRAKIDCCVCWTSFNAMAMCPNVKIVLCETNDVCLNFQFEQISKFSFEINSNDRHAQALRFFKKLIDKHRKRPKDEKKNFQSAQCARHKKISLVIFLIDSEHLQQNLVFFFISSVSYRWMTTFQCRCIKSNNVKHPLGTEIEFLFFKFERKCREEMSKRKKLFSMIRLTCRWRVLKLNVRKVERVTLRHILDPNPNEWTTI